MHLLGVTGITTTVIDENKNEVIISINFFPSTLLKCLQAKVNKRRVGLDFFFVSVNKMVSNNYSDKLN
jgi:hypothetical protein